MSEAPLWKNFFRKPDPRKEILKILKEVPLFANFSIRELKSIQELIHFRSFKAKECVFREGDPGYGLYTVLEGEVRVVLKYGQPDEIEIVRLKRGDFFGEFSLLDHAPRSATVESVGQTLLGGFFYPDLKELLDRNPSLAARFLWNLSRVLTERLRQTNEELRKVKEKLGQISL
jgi:CRP-like cAMP-binding protein